MEYILTRQEDKIIVLTINRPKALNALNKAVLTELWQTVQDIEKRLDTEDIRVLVITGSGEKAFVAGADIASMSTMTPEEGLAFGQFGNRVFAAIANLPIPVIAAVNGYALGGGFELALACDVRIASKNAMFAFPETGLGIIPGFGGTQRLARLTNPSTASDFIFSGRRATANAGICDKLVNKVVEQEELMPETMAYAKMIASRAPIAVRQAKKAIQEGLNLSLSEGLARESELFAECFATEDQKVAMDNFLNKVKVTEFRNK